MKPFLSFILLVCILQGTGFDLKSQNSEVEITYHQNNDNSVDFKYSKTMHGNVFVSIELDQLENTSQNRYQGCLKSNMGKVFTLKPKNPDGGIGFSYSYNYMRGKPIFRLKKDFVYLLPFKNETKVKMKS